MLDSRLHPRVFWLLVALIIGAGIWFRCSDRAAGVVRDDSIRIYDNDTMRRLVRLHALDESTQYPLRERRDGWPDGTVIHWTRPMDVVIRALDVVAQPFFPQAKAYEAGAIVAGPLLASVSIAIFAGFTALLAGRVLALVATLFYAFAYSIVNVSWLGNGDHQNLQHLALVVFLLGWLTSLGRTAARRTEVVAGAALGLAVWVSTESMLVLYGFALASGLTALAGPQGPHDLARRMLRYGLAATAVCALGHVIEAASWGAIEIDRISLFQLWQISAIAAFGFVLGHVPPTRAGALVAGVAGAVWGVLPFALPAVQSQLTDFAQINAWLQNEVTEFRSVFTGPTGFDVRNLLSRDSWLVVTLPAVLVLCARAHRLRQGEGLALSAITATAFGLEVWEVKLGHVFSILFPVAVVVAAREVGDRLAVARRTTAGATFAMAIAVAAFTSLPAKRSRLLRMTDDFVVELCEKLAARARGRPVRAVLAPWDLGAPILYYAGLPVVASGYHRNIAGILDAHRFFLGAANDTAATTEILEARDVGSVVAFYDRSWLESAPKTLGREPLLRRVGGAADYTRAHDTVFWRLRYGDGGLAGLRLYDSGPEVGLSTGPEPLYKIFER